MDLKSIKSWEFMFIIFLVLCVCAIAGVVVGLVLHEEPGLDPNAPRWDQGDFPLTVCPTTYRSDGVEELLPEHFTAVANVVGTVNSRLGFLAFELGSYHGDDCEVMITLDYPIEVGWTDPGGEALLSAGEEGVRCDVRTSNTYGELLWLTLYHELGHCLGLAHDDFEISIMREEQTETPDQALPPWISDFDRTLLRGIYGT